MYWLSTGGFVPSVNTSPNVIKTGRYIYSFLDPGSIWIKFRSLLWTSSGAALELSLDEVMRVVQLTGFELCLWTVQGDHGDHWLSASIQVISK
jgi:hypothetical protein